MKLFLAFIICLSGLFLIYNISALIVTKCDLIEAKVNHKMLINTIVRDMFIYYFLTQWQIKWLFKDINKNVIAKAIKEMNDNLYNFDHHYDQQKVGMIKLLKYINMPEWNFYQISLKFKLPKKLFEIYIKPFLLKYGDVDTLEVYINYLSKQDLIDIALINPSAYKWIKENVQDKEFLQTIEFIRALE